LGMGELGECGVVGQGGVMSKEPKPGEAEADPRGSYMTGRAGKISSKER
jgi:hypothetical protein